MKLAFTFPGQGSQTVGMGKEFADNFGSARVVFDEVNDALSQNLSKLMWAGPMEDLTLTANTQPALMACSLAVMAVLKHEFDVDVSVAKYVAGHSLGEYSALCAAGSLTVAETAKLLRLRGDAMQQAVPVGVGAMAALLGASLDDADTAIKAGAKRGVCQIANDNANGQVVLSGTKEAVEVALEAAKELGIKRAILLPVSAPFHCDLMESAARAMEEALADVDLKVPCVPVVNNVSASAISDPAQLKTDLVTQVTGRVRWRESVLYMRAKGVDAFAEPGTGKVLTGLLRRIEKGANGTALDTAIALEKFVKALK
ncbi:MAG: ACP S-malonyltransferase [Robiginitomaculum sp.]